MRDHLTILRDIEGYFSKNGLAAELQELQHEVRVAATGAELCLRVGSWLMTYHAYSKVDTAIDDLIMEFMEYCHFNGLYPK
jgi:hypothetical protein